jgi:hypothetical protein
MIERIWVQKKTGITKVGTYDDKIYYNTWYNNNKERLREKSTCECCKGRYSVSNYSNHTKTAKHMKAFALKNNQEKNL